MTTLIIIAYVVSVVISYGGTFAYFNGEYPSIAKNNHRENMAQSLMFALIPIAGFVVPFFMTGFFKHGFKFY